MKEKSISTYPPRGKKKIKIIREGTGLETERVHARHLEPRLTRQTSVPLQPSRFGSVIFKALSFQAVIGYLSIEVFSFSRIAFSIKKGVLLDFYLR